MFKSKYIKMDKHEDQKLTSMYDEIVQKVESEIQTKNLDYLKEQLKNSGDRDDKLTIKVINK